MKRMLAGMLSALCLLGTVATVLSISRVGEAADEGWTKLFNGKDLTGWDTFVDPRAKDVKPEDIWSVKDGVIICKGQVPGYLLSKEEYDNYVLRLEWRWGDTAARGRNSGVFVHVVGPNKIWPKAIEAQLMADHAGDFWLVDGAKLWVNPARQDQQTKRHYLRMQDGVEKPLGEWNQYEITCKGNAIKLVVNGHVVNIGTESELTRGKILLQSEGAEIHFRNVELKPIE
jgi:hypothetical protein